MPKFVKTTRSLSWGVLLLPFAVGVASAVPVDERELQRWVPSLSLVSGLNAQTIEGHLATSEVVGPPLPTPPPNVTNGQPVQQGSPATTRDRMMTPYAGAALELMTPAWIDIPGRPRAFAHVDVAVSFGPTYTNPSLGEVGPLRIPKAGGQTEDTILGQGGRVQATVSPLLVMAGAGIAFTTEVGERAVRIKPSFEYMREEIEISGVVQRAVQLTTPSPTLNEFRQILLGANTTQVYHGLGAGLEVEMDAGRAGPFVLSLYGAAKAWAFLDNQKVSLFDQNEYGENASFTFLKNEWAFGGALGLRFRWVPEKK